MPIVMPSCASFDARHQLPCVPDKAIALNIDAVHGANRCKPDRETDRLMLGGSRLPTTVHSTEC
jgi:hypothetical protein